MQQSESIDLIASALLKAARQLTAVQHDRRSAGPARNRYATLDAILLAVVPVLADVGITLQQGVTGCGGESGLTTQLTHDSGQWLRSTVTVPIGEPPKGATMIQCVGIHTTYLRRYALLSILGLTTTEDDRAAPVHRTDTDGVHGEATPPARWDEGQRKRFCASLGDLGVTYEDTRDFLVGKGRPKPSEDTEERRKACIGWLTKMPTVEARVAALVLT